MVLADRERTISELKKSISFLTKTFNKNMNIINYNISSALMKEENNNLDVNQSLKEFRKENATLPELQSSISAATFHV